MKIAKNRFQRLVQKNVASVLMGLAAYATKKIEPRWHIPLLLSRSMEFQENQELQIV